MAPNGRVESALRQMRLSYEQFASMTEDALRLHWRDLIKRSHPDLPENRDKAIDAGAINAAYDTLRQSFADRSRAAGQFGTAYDRASIAPPWQPDKGAKNNRIYVESYRDQNFIKKRIWELSDQSDEIYTIDAFGRTSFEGRTRVYGNQAVFDEMAKAMLVWNANGGNAQLTRAVLVSSSKQERTLYLIYADGKSLAHNPIPLKYDGRAGSPEKDRSFQAKLPLVLDKIREMLAGPGLAQAG